MAVSEFRQTGCKVDVEWEIAKFSIFVAKDYGCYFSPHFSFVDSLWCLHVTLSGNKPQYPEGWLGLYLSETSGEKQNDINIKIGLKMKNSAVKVFVEGAWNFDENNKTCGRLNCIKIEDLEKQKLYIKESDVLTVTCTLTTNSPRPVRSPLLVRLLQVSQNLKKMFIEGKGSDVTLNVGGCDIKAHKAVLANRSSVFAAMFDKDMASNTTDAVNINDIKLDVMRQVLLYIYSGEVQNMTAENVFEIFAAADKYDLIEVKIMCLTFMEDNMSENTVCDIIVFADKYEMTKLKEISRHYFEENSANILKTDHWQRLVKENNATAIQLLSSIVLEKVTNKK